MLFFWFVASVGAYSSGTGTCHATVASISAGMGGPLNTGSGGFTIAAPQNMTVGQSATLSILGPSTFNGFLLYAEDTATLSRVGSFSASNSQSPFVTGCNSAATTTQTNAGAKGPTKVFMYTPAQAGSVVFKAAVVLSVQIDWHILPSVTSNVFAGTVTSPSPSVSSSPSPSPGSSSTDLPNTSGFHVCNVGVCF